MRNRIAIVTTAGAALAGLLVGAQPAAAASGARKVTVTVQAAGVPAKTATLTCKPIGGTHTAAKEACAVLAAARGNPAAIIPADIMCTMEYSPVKVKVAGKWNGKAVKFKETFSNNCRTQAEGGALFRL